MNERAIFVSALEIEDPAARTAYLGEVCGNDHDLRTRVDALLASHAAAGEFLAVPAVKQIAAPAEAEGDPTLQLGDSSEDAQQAGNSRSRPGEVDATDILHPDVADAIPLSFLQPPTRERALGRLGHYEMLECLGQGAFGIVFRAFDDSLQRVVAVKVLAPALTVTSPPRKRFLREARNAAQVRHDHVVRIYAVEELPTPYLVMEYIPGETLQEKLDRVGPLEVPEVLRLGCQMARGLAAAHEQGLIHRDIKPGNILLEKGLEERVKISDFGLARAVDDAQLTQSGMIAGTPMFMAPEQARGETIDQRADLFSLGSVLYTMVSGRPPFRASNTVAVLKRVCDDTPRPISELIPETPPWLCDIIARLQAKNPADRFQGAGEVADLLGKRLAQLEQQSASAPINVAPDRSASGAPVSRPDRRQRWVAAAALLLVAFAGLGLSEATGVTQIAATVVHIFTPDGTLVVETDDPRVKVTVEGDGGLVITGTGLEEIRLRPGSYRIQAAKDGQPVALEKELVTITRGDKQTVRVRLEGAAPSTAAAASAERGVFVVLGGTDIPELKYDSLAEAVRGASDGDRIEIRGNGPYITETITVSNRALTIRAGDGYRPILFKDAVDGPDLLVAINAPLVIEGLEFRRDTPRDPKIKGPRDESAIRVFGGLLHVANCRFHLTQRNCIRIDGAARRCVLTNCEFVGIWCVLSGIQASGDEWEIDNCVAAGTELIGCAVTSPDQSGASIRVARTSVAVEASVFYLTFFNFPDRSEPGQPAAEIEVSECLLDTFTVIHTQHVEPFDLLARRLRWRGRENVYHLTATAVPADGGFVATLSPTGQDPWQGPRDLASWGEFWGSQEPGSVESRIRYQGGDLAARAVFAPKNISPEDFRLRADSAGYRAGHDNEDLGADVDLVGPGPAYQRWKTSPAYERWIEKTRQ